MMLCIGDVFDKQEAAAIRYEAENLRVCPDTLGRITKFSKHEPN